MPTTEDPITELSGELALAARTLFQAGGVAATLQSVVDLAETSIGGCEYVGVMLTEGALAGVRVASDPLVDHLDDLQRDLDDGATLEVINRGGALYAEDLESDFRWPRFAPEAVSSGIRSLLAIRLSAGDTLGAITLYSRYPAAFGTSDLANASSFATVAAHALSVAHVRETAERRLEDLQRALSTRELIGQAQGILMERDRITAERAFEILRIASQRLNVKLLEVAHQLVETGERPLPENLSP
ncbi:MAG TPA: GAF and ANTAR domain-containing protein [Acidimicrobiales bacterium]